MQLFLPCGKLYIMPKKEKKAITQDVSEESRVYELGFHIISSIPEEKIAEVVGAIKGVLESKKAAVISEDYPKFKQLAYMIRKESGGKYQKFTTAYFGWIKFEVDASSIISLKEEVEKLDAVLRTLVIHTVRESTLANIKVIQAVKEELKGDKPEAKKEDVLKTPATEAELDKTIEELVVA